MIISQNIKTFTTFFSQLYNFSLKYWEFGLSISKIVATALSIRNAQLQKEMRKSINISETLIIHLKKTGPVVYFKVANVGIQPLVL